MKHLWALSSTLVLTTTLVVSGVAAGAAAPTAHRSDADRTLQLSRSTEARVAATEAATVSQASVHGFYWQLTTSQDVQPGSLLMSQAQAAAHAKASKDSRGNRSDDQFFEISKTGSNDVPAAALRAYRHAEKVMATADPDCDISWTLLAAIGRVETNHGRFGGAQLGSDGVSRPEIRGPQLDGAGPFAAIRDSDNGVLDRDKVWDRAVGQMQFLPQTWRSVERDGDGDGTKNPDDIDDSALGSAVYLCGAGGSLADRAGMARAAFRYNHSDYYVSLVLSMQAGFETGVFALPSPPPPAKAKQVGKAKTPKTKPTRPRDVTKAKSKTSTKPRRRRPRPRGRPRPRSRRPSPRRPPSRSPSRSRSRPSRLHPSWSRSAGPGPSAVVGTASTPLRSTSPRCRSTPSRWWARPSRLKVERKAGRLVVHAVMSSASTQSSTQRRQPRPRRHPASRPDPRRSDERGTMSRCPSNSPTPASRLSAWSGSSRWWTSSRATW